MVDITNSFLDTYILRPLAHSFAHTKAQKPEFGANDTPVKAMKEGPMPRGRLFSRSAAVVFSS
ncbi:MAG: hypothetical protein ACRD1W_02080 [Vicinamibacterales bacterium]